MSGENLTPHTVVEILRITGANTAVFMENVANHVEQLELEVARLTERIKQLEASQDDFK